MDSSKDAIEGASATPVGSAAPSQQAKPEQPAKVSPPVAPASPTRPSVEPSSAYPAGRPPYIPQFSASTQMILKRINSQPGSLSSALSSASSIANSIEKSTFEDVKRRLVMNMNTSLTMAMPPFKPAAPKSKVGATLPLPMNDAFQLRTPAPAKAVAKQAAAGTTAQKAPAHAQSQKGKGKGPRGTKRKRGKDNDVDTSSSLSDISDSDGEAAVSTTASTKGQAAPTMTKSGRQVQKPSQYNPSQQSTQQQPRRKPSGGGGGKRTAEQALCKVCTRGLSPTGNQIVFCDGCNSCWHQLCHEPCIDDDFVSNESRSWFCGRCTAKRERLLARKKSLDAFKGVSWAGKSADQKRNYLNGVPHAQLVNIIMYCTELHPDLPIFPSNESLRRSNGMAFDSPTRYTRKLSTPDTHPANGGKTKAGAAADNRDWDRDRDREERESSMESVPPAWPKAGNGCLKGLRMDEDDLRDNNDYEAFSVTTYDDKGKKIMENGMPV
ncbi:hypothetical protein AAE478_002617 [Parahypoxylon ruwenzoriense]